MNKDDEEKKSLISKFYDYMVRGKVSLFVSFSLFGISILPGYFLSDTDSVCVHEHSIGCSCLCSCKVSSMIRFSPIVSSSDDRYCSVFALAVVDSLFTDSSSEVIFSSELK